MTLQRVIREQLLELHRVAARDHVEARLEIGQGLVQGAVLALEYPTTEPIARQQPLDRVPNEVDEPGIGHDARHAFGHVWVHRVAGIRRRRLTDDLRSGRKLVLVPRKPAVPVPVVEELRLLHG
jgi:hypothetical protein